jgi:hypothetical protein
MMSETCQLSPAQQVIFDEIMEEREPSHWTPHRRHIAALCAKELHRLQLAQEELRRTGYTVVNGRGRIVINPVTRIANKALRSVISFRRSLSIHGAGRDRRR